MVSITLKEIAGYLAHDLECFLTDDNKKETLIGLGQDQGIFDSDMYWFNQFKPLLYPLSMLTQEIEHNGEKFIPLEIIGKTINDEFVNIYNDENGSAVGYGERTGCGCPYDCDCGRLDRDFILKYNKDEKYFYSEISMDADYDNIIGEELYPSYNLIEKLYEWHFDIHGLIERGLAIDKSKT